MEHKVNDLTIQAWFITNRWQAFEGELRVAILRIVLVAMFYGLHLIHHLRWAVRSEGELIFHKQVTWLAAGGLFVSLAVLVALGQRFYPPVLKFGTTLLDLLLVTSVAALSSGPASPIVSGYYVILALSPLRFSVPLVWFATMGAMVGYVLLVGLVDTTWFDESHATEPIVQLITLCSMAAIGVAMGQLVRMMRLASQQFMFRHEHLEKIHLAGKEQSR